MELKIGDVVVSKEKQVQHNNPTKIEKIVSEKELKRIYWVSSDGRFIWFEDTPPGTGSYPISRFTKASKYEVKLFEKGVKFSSPESNFEEGDEIITTEIITSIEGNETIESGTQLIIEDIIKTTDKDKSIVWFKDKEGTYKITGFKICQK